MDLPYLETTETPKEHKYIHFQKNIVNENDEEGHFIAKINIHFRKRSDFCEGHEEVKE